MQIKNIQPNINNTNKQSVSYKGLDGRKILSMYQNPDSLLTTASLETCVTGGRGINAYQRSGIDELRERALDDIVSAVFWMKGVDMFNSLGDKFGKKFLNLQTTNFDIGKDALRTPFKNLSADLLKNNEEEAAKAMIKKLERFKFTKIIASSLLSTSIIGFVMPRINQKLSEKIMLHRKIDNKLDNNNTNKNVYMKAQSLEDFGKKASTNANPSFKGISEISHIMENNTIAKMLTNDAGIITGRVTSSRNSDEGIEYLFRDGTSLIFYFASTPLIYKGLQKATDSKNITNIDSVASRTLNKQLMAQLTSSDGKVATMSAEEFTKNVMGTLDESTKKFIDELPFKSDVISLKEFKTKVKDKDLRKRATQMSQLQPKQAGVGRVLTKQQVMDVYRNGSITQPKFMLNIFKEQFGNALTDSYRYISMDKITKFRENIDLYAQGVIDTAKKDNNGIIDSQLLEKVNKKSFRLSAGFRMFAMGVSAFCLGFVIPKLQYKLTELRTGSKTAPGFRKFEEKNTDTKSAKNI